MTGREITADVRDACQECYLACEESEHGGNEDLDIVFPVDLLLRKEEWYDPEQGSGNNRPEGKDSQWRNKFSAGQIFTHDDVESENCISDKRRQMSDNSIPLSHIRQIQDKYSGFELISLLAPHPNSQHIEYQQFI